MSAKKNASLISEIVFGNLIATAIPPIPVGELSKLVVAQFSLKRVFLRRVAAPEFRRGFQPTVGAMFYHVASATIEFSRRSRDAGIFSNRPVG